MINKDYLKPCPFCGKRAELIMTKHTPSGWDYTPRCTDTSCPGRCSKKYTVKETAIAKWNNRPNGLSSNNLRTLHKGEME